MAVRRPGGVLLWWDGIVCIPWGSKCLCVLLPFQLLGAGMLVPGRVTRGADPRKDSVLGEGTL